MTQPSATCPNCGAKIVFRWSSSVQTVCAYCQSVLVRTDVDLKKIGRISDLPPDSSPIQVNTEGLYRNRSFVVIGRILYAYENGGWNEWHLMMNTGENGWLSDAQSEYAVSFAVPGHKLPSSSQQVKVGQRFTWDARTYMVSSITRAHYKGVEGELPFEYWDKDEVMFVDLRSETGGFATLDYSDDEPALYVGELVDFADLQLKNLRAFEGWS